jgi:hypothetical protein
MTKKSDEPRSNSKPSHPDSSMKAVKPTMDTEAKPQAEKFKDLARELEADEDEAAFEERLKKLVQVPREHRSKEKPE